jgi:hypothetical protein
VVKLQLLFTLVVLVVWIFTLADVAQAPGKQVRLLPKVAWVVLVLLFPVLGSAAWFVLGRPQGTARTAVSERAQAFPEYDRPGRSAAVDPEKDEEFLKQVRARAEEQRSRYAEEKKREQQGRELEEGTAE